MAAPFSVLPDPDNVPQYATNIKHYGSFIESERPITYSKKGPSSKEVFPGVTLPQLLLRAVEKHGDQPALKVEDSLPDPIVDGKPQIPPSLPLDKWKTWTYKEYWDDSYKVAKALTKLGLERFQGVSIFGANAPEWSLSLYGCALAGGVSAGIYPSDTTDQVRYKCDYSNTVAVIVDTEASLKKVKEVIQDLSTVKAIVCWGNLSDKSSVVNQKGEQVKIFDWESFISSGSDVPDEEITRRIDEQKPTQCAALIYTSGTTGKPKAVMMSHDAIIFSSFGLMKAKNLGEFGHAREQDRVLSYLPMCHVAGLMVDILIPVVATAFMESWVTVAFARPYDLRMGSLVSRLQVVQPTLFLGVPRVWEKLVQFLEIQIENMGSLNKSLTKWAMKQGYNYMQSVDFNAENPRAASEVSKPFMFSIADKLALSYLRDKIGLGKAKFCETGAAPIQVETQKYIASIGINIHEIYGMSEGCGVSIYNTSEYHKWGSIGASIPFEDAKCFHVDPEDINKKTLVPPTTDFDHPTEEEQGELCFRFRGMMIGYMANPRLGKEHVEEIEEKNRTSIDNEGYMHTGDKMSMSKEGFFKITGRYKEIIIGAGGENIAPVPIEDELKKLCPFISNVVMIGDRRKFNVCLITLKLEGATGAVPGTNKLLLASFADVKTQSKTIEEAMKDEGLIRLITESLMKVNENGKVCVSHAAKIQKFMILPRDLSITTDDFTPTLKLRRSAVADRFANVIDKMYSSQEIYVPFPENQFEKYFG